MTSFSSSGSGSVLIGLTVCLVSHACDCLSGKRGDWGFDEATAVFVFCPNENENEEAASGALL